MRVSSIEAVFDSLHRAGVRYLVVGGLAVNAHGYGRATFDIDLVIDLDPGNVNLLFQALGGLGFQPLVPVSASDFGNPETRERWGREKGMVVLQFFSERHRETRVDVFAHMPFGFDEEWQRAVVEEIKPGVAIRIVALETLIGMKETAGRPKVLDDLEALRWLAKEAGDGS
ncbi:MAG: hypothetical protein ACC742_04765 [Thermoanaerobaculales bacterium]